MKIVINALPYFSYQGIEYFLANLIQAWPANKDDEITILANEISARFFESWPDNFKLEIIKFKKIDKLSIFIFQQLKLGRLLKKRKTDLLFCASLNCPWLYAKKIVTIHDAAPFVIKGESGQIGKMYWKISLFFAKHFSLHILTVSEFSRQELIEKLKINKDKLDIIYPAPPIITTSYKNQAEIKNPYVIVIGNARFRKNLQVLFKAYSLIKNEFSDLLLIVIGKMDKEMKILANSSQDPNIQFTGFVSDEKKYKLLGGAKALIFPSLYEGFGSPNLEAQIIGTPVICSDIPPFKEVTGNSALFFDPMSPEKLAEAIKKIILSPELADNLRHQGAINCQRFDWRESAKKLSEIIHLYENPADK
ncbi:MAG: glycosyltransferase family 1 protein [Patescibacteria group bacterium]|nr:glycosyltransferase family 1 protein [Patescibacteria group bacterium]